MKIMGRIIMPIVLAGTVLSLTGCMDDFFYDNPPPRAIMTTPASKVQPVQSSATTVKSAPKKAEGPSADHQTPSAVEIKTQEAPPIAPPVSNLAN